MEQLNQPRFKLSEEEIVRILAELEKRFKKLVCPLCKNEEFVISDGYFKHPISATMDAGIVIGGLTVPTIALFCKQCGFVMEFSLGILGLIPRIGPDVRIVREFKGRGEK